MLRFVGALGVVLAVLAMVGCGGGNGNAPGEVTSADVAPTGGLLPTGLLLPLAVDYYWRYKEFSFMGGGLPAAQAETPGVENRAATVYVSKLRVVKQLRLDGVLWWQANRTWVGQTWFSREYYRHNANGLLRKWDASMSAFYGIKTPLAIDNTWPNDIEYATMRIVALHASVVVPYGTVSDCLVVEQISKSDPTVKSKLYYRSGLGIVREIYFSGGNVTSRVDLWQTNVPLPD